MSRKIVVTPSNERISKSVAKLLIRRLIADWVVEGVSIQLRSIRAIPKGWMSEKFAAPTKPYIPERMPPVDIPGVRFIPPAPKPWQPISASA